MADEKKKLTVAEILAAARKQDAKGDSPAPSKAAPAEETPAAASEPTASAAEPTAAKPAAPAKSAKPAAASGDRPSVKDILAMARGGGGTPAAAAPKADKPAVAKAAPKPAVEKKPAAEKADKPAAAAATSTASILAAARAGAKPGPMTKAEAAAKPKPALTAPKGKSEIAAPPMPVKPAYAKPAPGKVVAPAGETRRGFMATILGSFLGLGFTSLAATTGLWTLATARFMFPNILTEPPSRFKVGFPANFAPGQVETKFVAQFGVWVVNYEYKGQPELYALRTVCTHLGCTPNWLEAEQKFKCPCHGSGFYKDGINFEGPAPRPLERYAIRIGDDGQLEIDKSKLFQEEMGQWNDPQSFVPV